MIRIDENYTEFRDDNDPDYPGGKAVDAPTPDSFEGTPFMARWMNDVNGFRQAVFREAFGSLDGISGEPDNANKSDTLAAIEKLLLDGITTGATATFVIDSSEALEAWANNTPGNDYSRILIKAGTWTISRSVPHGSIAIDVSDGRTLSVVAEAGSEIVLNSTIAGFANITFIRGGSLLHNVNATIRRVSPGTSISSCFAACSNLVNCTGRVDGGQSTNIFFDCSNLTDCTAVAGIVSSQEAFRNCTGLTNCTISGSGTFGDCTGLTNCTISGPGAFRNCTNLTNCTGTGGNGGNHSFTPGTGNAGGRGGNGGTGFAACHNLVNCAGGSASGGIGTPATGPGAAGDGFSRCRTGFGNRGSVSNCLMAQGTNTPATNDWANTAAGGWNLP